MAIKLLKTSISIGETQKMLYQWKAWGVSDSARLKLLDLYLGMPYFMNEEGVYPVNNLYKICLSLKTIHTSDILEYIKKCKSFGLIRNENRTQIIAFFSPLWHARTTVSVSPIVSPAETIGETDNSILYNIIIIYILRRIPVREILPKKGRKILWKLLTERLAASNSLRLHLPKFFSISSTLIPKRRNGY